MKYGSVIDLQQNELQNARIQNLSGAPSSPVPGQVYYDTTTNDLYFYNGTMWLPTSGAGVLSFNTRTGAVTLTKADVTGTSLGISDLVAPTGDVSWASHKLINLLDPTNPQDGATKNYVDTVALGLNPKQSVRVATIGTETFTITSGTVTQISGTTLDGTSPSVGDRILIKDAPAATGTGSAGSSEPGNGIYTVTNNTTNLSVSRSTDMSGTEAPAGAYVFVEAGTTNASAGYVVSTPSSGAAFTYGTNNIQWTQFSGAGEVIAGTGLTKTGNTLALSVPVSIADGGTNATSAAAALANLGGTTKYAVAFGDGSSVNYTITHNLNTRDVHVAVYSATTPYNAIMIDWAPTTVNTVTIGPFGTAPTTNQFRVVVIG